MKKSIYNKQDVEAAKIIDAFLPDKLFDAHMHITHRGPMYEVGTSFDDYYANIECFPKTEKCVVME